MCAMWVVYLLGHLSYSLGQSQVPGLPELTHQIQIIKWVPVVPNKHSQLPSGPNVAVN
jgi:hypothetical protein